jgi:imidazolonepropionase-like amidohydrolase
MLAIRVGQLIDGCGGAPLQNATVLVDNGRIVQVGPAAAVQVPPDAEVLEAGAHSVIPGMIDCHVHIHSQGGPVQNNNYALQQVTLSQGTMALRASFYARLDLEMGFTTVRTVSSPSYVDVALRDAINEGTVEGPRLKVSGQGITITGGHMDGGKWSADVTIAGRTGIGDGPWELRKATRMQIKRGVDMIKINAAVSRYSMDYSQVEPYHQEMTYEEMAAICEEAHWSGKRVAAHAHGGQGITDALRAGLDSVEHGVWLTEAQVDTMARQGTYYVPTLSVHSVGWELGTEGAGLTPASRNWLAQVMDARWVSLERARKAGVKVATGTDAGFWMSHGKNARELEDLVTGGFTPMEAIVAATRTGSECLDMAREVGTIEPGKFADLVVVDGDPLSDVRILQDRSKIIQVLKGGKRVKA